MTNPKKQDIRLSKTMGDIEELLKMIEKDGITPEMMYDILSNIYWALNVRDEQILIVLENLLSINSKYHVIIRKLRLKWHEFNF
jgi:hypothetical protein